MRKVTGSFNGTGDILVIGCGFKPDYVKVVNVTSANLESIEFNSFMAVGGAAVAGGIKRSGLESVSASKLTAANGIQVYSAGDKAAADQTKFLVHSPANEDYEFAAAAAGTVIPAGFALAADADVNVAAETCYFEAGFFD